MTLADDIAAALTTAGYSGLCAYDWQPGKNIFIKPYGGTLDMVASIDGSNDSDLFQPRLQIQVRNASLSSAQTSAYAIIALLHRGTVANSLAVTWDGRAADHWVDDNGLHVFSVEFRVLRNAGLVS